MQELFMQNYLHHFPKQQTIAQKMIYPLFMKKNVQDNETFYKFE